MRIIIFLLILLTTFSCAKKKSDSNESDEILAKELVFENEEKPNENDRIEFYKIIKELEKIKFYLTGKDSIYATKNIFDFNGKSGTNTFQKIFAESEKNIEIFNSIVKSTKYYVKRIDGKTGNRPSANIIQLEFSTKKDATDWFSIYDNSPEKGMIQIKPKTVLWLDNNHIYFIQTYHTPKRDYLNLLKETIIKNLNKYRNF